MYTFYAMMFLMSLYKLCIRSNEIVNILFGDFIVRIEWLNVTFVM